MIDCTYNYKCDDQHKIDHVKNLISEYTEGLIEFCDSAGLSVKDTKSVVEQDKNLDRLNKVLTNCHITMIPESITVIL